MLQDSQSGEICEEPALYLREVVVGETQRLQGRLANERAVVDLGQAVTVHVTETFLQ